MALLVSLHASFLNEGNRGRTPELDAFLDKQIEWQAKWCESLGVSKQDADRAYAKMRCCDRLSLILCQQQIPDGERWLEIDKGPTGDRHDILQRPDGKLTVKPWPFNESEFTVRVDACYPTQMQFASNEELIASLEQAPIKSIEWQFAA